MMIVVEIEWLVFLLLISFLAGVICDAVYGIRHALERKQEKETSENTPESNNQE